MATLSDAYTITLFVAYYIMDVSFLQKWPFCPVRSDVPQLRYPPQLAAENPLDRH